MRDEIAWQLGKIEQEHDCRILYACESGSRAWGFESVDSDFDVRFVYVKPLPWHLDLQTQSDTIDIKAPNDLDLGGWELGKMLRLFASCNLALNEWFDSPIVYGQVEGFADQIRGLIPCWFNGRKAIHHYRSIAQNSLGDVTGGNDIRIKKLFYVLRPLLACKWIMTNHTMPPMEFGRLMPQDYDGQIKEQIEAILRIKKDSTEKDTIQIPPLLLGWIVDLMKEIEDRADEVPAGDRGGQDWEMLNGIFRKEVLETRQ